MSATFISLLYEEGHPYTLHCAHVRQVTMAHSHHCLMNNSAACSDTFKKSDFKPLAVKHMRYVLLEASAIIDAF